jgi:glycogen phosphorylase
MPNGSDARIAYFSMEIAVDPAMPTYAGGLGVLAGDLLRSAADLELPMIGVTLLPRQGYFHQTLNAQGQQSEQPESWSIEASLEPLDLKVPLTLDAHRIYVRPWLYWIKGLTGHRVPVCFLDTNLPENPDWERSLSNSLYSGDDRDRLCQEAVLGIGGVRVLRAMGHRGIVRFHMNEGHSALLSMAVLEERLGRQNLSVATDKDIEAVREQCVFTTHTPVPAAFDQFSLELAKQIIGQDRVAVLQAANALHVGSLNMAYLGLRFSRYVNGVAMHHGEISHTMFPAYPIHAITNGVHAASWTSPPLQELFDRHIPEWRHDNLYLRYSIGIDVQEIRNAHIKAKSEMIRQIAQRTGTKLNENAAILGFARRASQYKRADLIFADLDRLRAIRQKVGPFQIVSGGKAHPHDEEGKAVIRKVFAAAAALRDAIPVVYVENYDLSSAPVLTSGVDLWLNTPTVPTRRPAPAA